MTNKFSQKNICKAVLLLIIFVSFSGCNRDRNHPGWDYFPDMFYSTAYETYSKNPNFEDGKTMRTPVPGTIAVGAMPFEYVNDPVSRIKAGKELINPFLPDVEAISRGKDIYTVFCLECHGSKGDGNGYLYTSGLYSLKPRNLLDTVSARLKDGEIYHTITLGIRSMGAHGSQIRSDDRWTVVLYIRKLQDEAQVKTDPQK
jgi:mono/diheme cytochrome c family protein